MSAAMPARAFSCFNWNKSKNMLANISYSIYNRDNKIREGKEVVELEEWKRELFWCFVGGVIGTGVSELYQALKEKTSRRAGKHFKRS